MTNEELKMLLNLHKANKRKLQLMVAALLILLIICFTARIFVGSVDLDFKTAIDALMGKASWSQNQIVRDIRTPRLICAAAVGASLSVAGMAMQALFKNPMASPSVLGISSGASFGAALYIAVGYGMFQMAYGASLCAFLMAALTMFLVYALAYQKRGVNTLMLLLAGMAISALFSGLTSTIEFFSDADTVNSIVFWMLGSFEGSNWIDVKVILIPAIIGMILILINARELNIISAGEGKARALGVNVKNVRIMLLIGSSILVASSVSICGVISFVGLIIPHIFRTLGGPDHKYLAPMCILGGALFMIIVDTVARSIMPPHELPVGVITSLIGAPFFIYIMRTKKKEIWSS